MNEPAISGRTSSVLVVGMILIGLYLAKSYNYLLFHVLVEFFSVAVACGIFMIAWNTRRIMDNNYLLFIGIASLFVGSIDLVHTLAYKGMNVFPGYGPNLATQLWIAARYLQSIALLVAPWFIGRKLKSGPVLAVFGTITSLLLAAVFSGYFPDCFVEGLGLTLFKKGSEYLICLLLLGALLFMHRKMSTFDQSVVRFLTSAIVSFIAAELAFTLYTDVYGISNAIGHFLKFAGFYLVYKALIETSLAKPYALLFRELKESEERYRHLYKDTPVMLHSIDRDGRLVSVSNFWLEYLGYDRDETIGRKITEFFTEESRCYAEEVVLPEFFKSGACKKVPYQLVKKNGEMLDVLLTATAERDEQGEINRSLTVMIDITEQKLAAEQIEDLSASIADKAIELEEANVELESANAELEISNQALGETNQRLEAANLELEAFSHTVSHDLRSPLTCISGFCQILNEQCADQLDVQCKGFIDNIHDETLRMDQLISALLNFSQLNRQELLRETIDLSEIANACVLGLQMREPDRQIKVSVAAGVTVDGDPLLLRVVMENLLGNAWKYTGKQAAASIEFGVQETDGKPVYFVRDNGAGFDMTEAHRMFAAFQRLHDRSEFEGTGIGLTTVQRIIQRHGGRIWAEGEKGKGATFFFTL